MNQSQSHVEQLKAQISKGSKISLEQLNTIYVLQCKLQNAEDIISTLKFRIESLQEQIITGEDCPCDDWETCGTDPLTWDKLKKCNICDKISIR